MEQSVSGEVERPQLGRQPEMTPEQAEEHRRRGRPRKVMTPLEISDGNTDDFLAIDPGTPKVRILDPVMKVISVDPEKEPPFSRTITWTDFQRVHGEVSAWMWSQREAQQRSPSINDMVSWMAKRYLKRNMTFDEVESIVKKHTDWQKAYYEATGNSEIPKDDMTEKMLNIFSVGVMPMIKL